MTDKHHYRRAISGKLQMAEHAATITTALASEAQIHLFFGGATTIDAVANRITELVLAHQPELLTDSDELTPEQLLQMLAIAAQTTVLTSLDDPNPSQRSMLIVTVANYFANKDYDPELAPEFQALASQIQTLHKHWQTVQQQRQRGMKSMGR